ncbi:hexameric tyrosine-coordinated heme protein [Pistricoccus aurantiacus]|uniref:hexameric tyrosine-coordinated heme protein n=1 Tax=Pistricoccus aurantiacus TaxID=1883414 RepID=UPI00363D4E67
MNRIKNLLATRNGVLPSLLLSGMLTLGLTSMVSAEDTQDSESWLPSLITETPQEGFQLAVKLSQKGVATTQPDASVRKALRGAYAHDPDSLIAATQVIAIHFQTVAAANDYWREE